MSKIEILRSYMKKCGVSACIIPTADPHLSEYIPDCYKLREWLSGFTGSAGTLVVTENESGLWTDGRYYIQAEKELFGSGIALFKASEKDCVKIHAFLGESLKKGCCVGVNGSLFSKNKLDETISELKKYEINVKTDFFPETIWDERPKMPKEKIFVLDEKYSGESVSSKVSKVREIMQNDGVSHYLAGLSECIMWLLNIRGDDIKHNMVALSYLILTKKDIFLYVDEEKIDDKTRKYLENSGVTLKNYNTVFQDVQNIGENYFVAADYDITNYNLINALSCAHKNRKDYIYNIKCIKNDIEIENIKRAYIKENTALVKSFYEIYNSDGINEYDVSMIIEKHRKMSENYFSPSFDTIAAYGKNAAMMHYCAEKNNCSEILRKGLLLIDTGGQYFEGTTDTTRTLVMGEITQEQKENLTLVLKGNISLAMSFFPQGSTGSSIDAIARMPLWKKGLDYRCSTGHGIGYFLGVHEGPQRISSLSKEKLVPNMTISNEPGVYIENEYGIRIENHMCIREYKDSEYGKFYCFEVLNFCPIGTEGIVAELLDDEQRDWLNSYNERCKELLKEHLTKEEYEWLTKFVKAI